MNRLFIPFLSCIFVWFGCNNQSTETTSTVPKFAFYKLADSTIDATKAWTLPIDSLTLSSVPFLTDNDLTAYYWSTHSFTTHPNIDTIFSHLRWLGGKSFGEPFVVVANGSRIYIAALWWSYSSMIPMSAYIDVILPPPYIIKRWGTASLSDMRGDIRIHNALRSAGILIE
jgi:hypothetical protein